MALPPQAIEKLIREPSRTQGAYRELLLISGALFGLSVLIYLGLAFGYSAYLRSSLAAVDEQIRNFSAGISQEERAELQGFYSQLVNLRTLLAEHAVGSPVLSLLERTVQPDVYYTKLTLNVNNNQAVLTGASLSLENVAAQAAALKSQPEVERVDFNNAGAQEEGPWQFTITLYLRPDVFRSAVGDATGGSAAPALPEAPAAAPTTEPTPPADGTPTSTDTESTPASAPATPTTTTPTP